MRDKKGKIEMLLLLCCLVGVVSFFSISLAFTSSLQEHSNKSEHLKQCQDLAKEKEEKETKANRLEEEKKKLKKQIEEREDILYHLERVSENEKKGLEKEVSTLNEEYNLLNQKIKNLKKQLATLITLPDPESKQEKERELEELKKRLQELENELRGKNALLAGHAKKSGEDLFQKKENLTKELEKYRKKQERIMEEIKALKLRALTAGISQFKHPLFIECRKDFYILYPNKELLAMSELERGNVFKEKSAGNDVIVLFIRPDGIESFSRAYPKVKALSIPLSYEPLEADQELDLLKGVKI